MAKSMANRRGAILLGCVLACTMAGACYSAVRLAYADHLAQADSPGQVRKALLIAPDNANFWLRWVDLQEAAGQPGDEGIAHAAVIDPFNATVWIRAGLHAEMSGDYVRAEKYLLRAAEQSRQFEPRWTLANFYSRRNDEAHFWPWAKSALIWASGDRMLLFDLFWRMHPDANTIVHQAIPDDPKILRDYLTYLMHNNHAAAALAIAEKVQAQASGNDRDILLRYTDFMLREGRWKAAQSAWNALSSRGLLNYPALDPAKGQSLTNGDFTADLSGSGFDWQLLRVDGVTAVHSRDPGTIRFEFSGNQPENCNVLNQFVPVTPGRTYSLRFGYWTEGIAPNTGLQWKVIDATTHAELHTKRSDLSGPQWSTGETSFVVPPGVETVRLLLAYRRPLGTVRIEGTVWLRNVTLGRLP